MRTYADLCGLDRTYVDLAGLMWTWPDLCGLGRMYADLPVVLPAAGGNTRSGNYRAVPRHCWADERE